MLFEKLATTSATVAATAKRSEKVGHLGALLRELKAHEIVPSVAFLIGTTSLGRIGVGWAALSAVRPSPAVEATLTVVDVDEALRRIEAMSGTGATQRRRVALDHLFARTTAVEQALLAGILAGELRQGAGDGLMASAIAAGAGVTVASVHRAAMFAGDLGTAAVAALTGGGDSLDAIELQPTRAVSPMLASTSSDVAAAIAATGFAVVETKLDGVRVQAHRRGGEVRLFTRNLHDVTARLPGVVAMVAGLPGGDIVLDGEVMGVDDDGLQRTFQDTIGDFAADADDDVHSTRGRDLRAWFFDVVYADGVPLVDKPLEVRRAVLERIVGPAGRPNAIVTADADVAQRFFIDAVAAGHEGVIVKDLTAPYEAGRRGSGWRKVKPVHTLDLVVLAVEWGSGRRRGWLSNLHLGARNDGSVPGGSPFVMVGKTFKGMTDEMLRWQTERFSKLRADTIQTGDNDPQRWERHRDVIRVRPEQVVEIAVDGVQRSTTYPAGVALRFARVKTYRRDKDPAEADTIAAVRSLG